MLGFEGTMKTLIIDTGRLSLSRLCPVKAITSKNTRKIGKLSIRQGKRWVAEGKE